MNKRIHATIIRPLLTLCLALTAWTQAGAQGVVIYKTNGETTILQASDIKEIVPFGYGEKPWTEVTGGKVYTVNGVKFTMVEVEGGSCTYTSRHIYRLEKFSIGQTEVTQALWEAVMGSNPSYSKGMIGPNFPVNNVSWHDCQTFIVKLNQLTGLEFRLPNQFEWYYAAFGGNNGKKYKFSGSDDAGEVAWYSANSDWHVHEVATKSPNELGIYDMSGNVEEWCYNWYGSLPSSGAIGTSYQGPANKTERAYKGGGYTSSESELNNGWGFSYAPSSKYSYLGLRLAL